VSPRGALQPLCPGCLITSVLDADAGEDAGDADDHPPDIPYQIVTLIERHADGATYLARPPDASTLVALRIVGPRDDGPAILNRVRTWKPALTQVRNPHVARMLDVGSADDRCVYVAAEFIGGPSLAVPACREQLSAADRRAVVSQLATALAALHACGVTHLRLDASRVKISTHDGIHATMIGLGTGLIVDGLPASPQQDLDALASLAHGLGVAP
jgi:hypothetical protein